MTSSGDGFDPDEAPVKDRLRMLLFCCHPALSQTAQVCLALKRCGGLGLDEIARVFQIPVAKVQQRLVRAKRTLRTVAATLDLPADADLAVRIETVLTILFAISGEAYVATVGDLTRDDLIAEAIRLTSLLAAHPLGDTPATHALLALMLPQAAHRPGRSGLTSPLLTIAEQDPSRWDQRLIGRGMTHLARAAAGTRLTAYHLLAEISAVHALPAPVLGPVWGQILRCYDGLIEREPRAILRLNRVVALANTGRLQDAQAEMDALRGDTTITRYYLFPATDAELLRRAGDRDAAAAAYRRAEALTRNEAELAYLAARQAGLAQSSDPAGAGTEPSSAGDPSLVT